MTPDDAVKVPAERPLFRSPWFVAVWPGMGNVAANAGVYLLARLGMHVLGELDTNGIFDVDEVSVSAGRIQPPRRPRNRLFAWKDPQEKRDLIVFLGEAQPASGKYDFARQLIGMARGFGAVRLFTFAAMATEMEPGRPSRVFGATTDEGLLDELKRHGLEPLDGGNIGGLNGILPGVAAESGLAGTCLLGEMPHVFAHLPYPKASLAILEAFQKLGGPKIDLSELANQARAVDDQLGAFWERLRQASGQGDSTEEDTDTFRAEPPEESKLTPADERRIDELFKQAAADRAKAFELKQELDRLDAFKDYEDRFLDLFKMGERD
jgi:proteasome assembly chaperone (PAC2) family protein